VEPVPLLVLADAEAVARAAAERFREAALDALRRRGRFVAVLAGGSTPRLLYRQLAADSGRPPLPWASTVVLFGDERAVGPDHADSNYRMARESLLDHVGVPARQVHRMRGEAGDLHGAAAEYEALVRGLFPADGGPRFDLLLLGVGEDGHTASLFPGSSALDERQRWVVAHHVPRLGAWRITLTLPALCAARRILFLASGEAKSRAVAEAFGGLPHPAPHPCEQVAPLDGSREVLLDRPAARLLGRARGALDLG
jgi:6-phosphogluconolactonase